jgi:two-component system, NarL family, nitrate/nitrite response regulator NarL
MVLRSTSAALAHAGFQVTEALTAREALESIHQHLPEALLIDIEMPGNRDLELLRTLDAERVHLPVVILTGRPTLATAVGAVRLGVVDYISKPPDIPDLLARLDIAVHRGRVLRSLEVAESLSNQLSENLATLKHVIRQGPGGKLLAPAPGGPFDALRNLDDDALERLSPRERDVVRELAKGNSPQKVAETLALSTNTIRNHLKSIFVKLRVNSQVELLGKLASQRR